MPNLIHSLDSTTLIMLRNEFYKLHPTYNNFYCIHDCFAVTAEKVTDLLILIRSIYISLYVDDLYLERFDKGIINNILIAYSDTIKLEDRTLKDGNKRYMLHDIDWVCNRKEIYQEKIREINSQYILN